MNVAQYTDAASEIVTATDAPTGLLAVFVCMVAIYLFAVGYFGVLPKP